MMVLYFYNAMFILLIVYIQNYIILGEMKQSSVEVGPFYDKMRDLNTVKRERWKDDYNPIQNDCCASDMVFTCG